MKIKFNPVNDLLLCKKVEIEESVGGVILADPDKWQKRAEVIAASPKVSPFVDEYKEGDVIIYPLGAKEFKFRIDDEEFIALKKGDVVTKIIEE